MRIQVLTIFPELFEPFLVTSLVGRAAAAGSLDVTVHDLRRWTEDKHRSVDDEPYGGGGGMVMTAQPWLSAVAALTDGRPTRKILLSPQGRRLDEGGVRRLATAAEGEDLLLLCGRYEAIDERVLEMAVDEEVSIGDYVLSGGELPAMVLIEALSRQIPGVVGLADSVENDSFRSGLLDYPHYTRPHTVAGREVPDVLLSGDHAAIERWRAEAALEATWRKRRDLLTPETRRRLTPEQRRRLERLEAREPRSLVETTN